MYILLQPLSHLRYISYFFVILFYTTQQFQYQDQYDEKSVKCKTCDANTYQADDKKEAVNHDNKEEDCLH